MLLLLFYFVPVRVVRISIDVNAASTDTVQSPVVRLSKRNENLTQGLPSTPHADKQQYTYADPSIIGSRTDRTVATKIGKVVDRSQTQRATLKSSIIKKNGLAWRIEHDIETDRKINDPKFRRVSTK